MKVGLVCPYSWDVPGGVQAHVRDLAETLLTLGHQVSVLTPADDDDALPPYAVGAGRAVPIPYNGSVARLLLGPVSATRVRRWLRDGQFDVLHVHEPVAPSISLLACYLATGPMVATFHTSNPRSRLLMVSQGLFQPALEKLGGRIAVSEPARRTTVEHMSGDAVLIPNGVAVAHFATAPVLAGHPDGRTLLFVGRVEEPRKGLAVLFEALALLADPVTLIVAGPGRVDLPAALTGRVRLLGQVDEATKASLLRSADIVVAPNTGLESFGIVLLEALAAGTPLVASDIDAFRRVLDGGRGGLLVPPGDPAALAGAIESLLADPVARQRLAAAGRLVVAGYDWPQVAARVVAVYETVTAGRAAEPVGVDPSPEAEQAAAAAVVATAEPLPVPLGAVLDRGVEGRAALRQYRQASARLASWVAKARGVS